MNNSLFSNPYHRSCQCQPELSFSPLARAGAREGQININAQLCTCRGTLALIEGTLGFRLICPLMLQHCNATWRERAREISVQIDTGLFFAPFIRPETYSGLIFQPSKHQRVHFYSPIHSSLFIFSLKATPLVCPRLVLHVQERIKESSAAQASSSFLICNVFIYCGGVIYPSCLNTGLWHHLM